MAGDTWLVLGLGNPGTTYEGTRHNIGFMVVDELAARMSARFAPHKPTARAGKSLIFQAVLRQPSLTVAPSPTVPREPLRLVVAQPQTMMNNSGHAAAGLAQYFRIPPQRVVVIHDELDVAFGSMRLKFGGGDNGHNGLRSIRTCLKTGDFFRIRMGIGRPVGTNVPLSYVLGRFPVAQRNVLPRLLVEGADALESLIIHGLQRTQSAFNS